MIIKVDRDTELAKMLLSFAENCSWDGVKDHIADMLRSWTFSDWETMFAAIADGKIVGMASVMKTDYYPLAEIYPWVSCVFVSEDFRGQKISGELIEYANRYLKENGFGRSGRHYGSAESQRPNGMGRADEFLPRPCIRNCLSSSNLYIRQGPSYRENDTKDLLLIALSKIRIQRRRGT